MNYRRIFHMSSAQLAECDLKDVLIDLEMLSLEEEYSQTPEVKEESVETQIGK
jgi:hypothetical protein